MEDRREFLKKGAVAGALVWATPAIVTLPGAAAHAQGSPPPGPQCECQNFARGLVIPGVGSFGQGGCEASVSAGGVDASAVCGETSQRGDVCRAEASVASVTIVTPGDAHTITATGLSSRSESTCCTSTSSSQVASLTIDGESFTVGSEFLFIERNGLIVVANNENGVCGNSNFSGRGRQALIVGQGSFQVIVAQTEARSGPCPC